MVHKVFFVLPSSHLVPLKWTSIIPNRFGLIYKSSLPVTLRVGNGVINKQLIGVFRVDGLGWSLGLGVNGNMGQVQVWKKALT